MAIIISGGPQEEALDYKYIHMVSLSIKQDMLEQVDEIPRYHVVIVYRLYAVDSAGKKHYSATTRSIKMSDYMKEAIEKANAGDLDYLNAVQGIEKAMATIIREHDNTIATTVVQ